MAAYYNEIDPFAAQWLRNLIAAGLIAPGDVDERSIIDVRPDDLCGYTQAHFFAGIGGWSIALRAAGWPDDRPVWTGSCPCQPFSAAGKGEAFDDERHLWPSWFSLIEKLAPPVVFGEQVEAAVGWGWLDTVFSDLENQGYAVGAAVLPACSLGGPHIRQRLWFVAAANSSRERGRLGEKGRTSSSDEGKMEGRVGQRLRVLDERVSADGDLADSDGGDASAEGLQRGGEHGQRQKDGSAVSLADAERGGRQQQPLEGCASEFEASNGKEQLFEPRHNGASANLLGDTDQPGLEGRRIKFGERAGELTTRPAGPLNGFWRDAEWIYCTDGKWRPVEPGSFPLGHGIPRRAPKLRAYGNAIVPQVATEFILAADFAMSAID